MEDFCIEKFHAHAMENTLKEEPIGKVNLGGYFGLDCSDAIFDELIKYVVKHIADLDEV